MWDKLTKIPRMSKSVLISPVTRNKTTDFFFFINPSHMVGKVQMKESLCFQARKLFQGTVTPLALDGLGLI